MTLFLKNCRFENLGKRKSGQDALDLQGRNAVLLRELDVMRKSEK
jgi:hypothetical protein